MSRDDEQVWAELVESFHSSSDDETPRWPDAEDVDPNESPVEPDDAASAKLTPTPEPSAPDPDEPLVPRHDPDEPLVPRHDPDEPLVPRHDPDEHFVPPPPPPIPSSDLITRLAWLGVLGTPLFFLISVVLGKPVAGWIGVVGAGAFIGGFVLLLVRLRGHDPYDPDDGAVV